LFLKGVIAAGGATALTAVSAPHIADPLDIADPLEDKQAGPGSNTASVSKGYRETAHIKAYYRTLRD
jgi:hypothetical protein